MALPAAGSLPQLPAPPRFVPYGELGEQPNIIVDGPPQSATVLALSHWPNNQTPDELKRDTSTAIVFAYLDRPTLHREVPAVSNSHFDEDGLFSMFALVDPVTATANRELLIDASLAGDFGRFESRDAARLVFTVEAFADQRVSPLPRRTFAACERRRAASLYQQMLERLPLLLADLPGHEACWAAQDAHLEDSLQRVATGAVEVQEFPELDLAVIRIPADLPPRAVRRYLRAERVPVHPFAIHRATPCNRLLRIQGRRFELQYRYESWVQMASARPALRVALEPFAASLNECESAPGTWRAEAVTDVAPRLYLDCAEASGIPETEFIARLADYLDTAPVAWDPYDWQG